MAKVKIDYISDLHLETYSSKFVDNVINAFEKLKNKGDYCALAGDIHPIYKWGESTTYKLFSYLKDNYKYVFYCMGNHELYGAHKLFERIDSNVNVFFHQINAETVSLKLSKPLYSKSPPPNLLIPSFYTEEQHTFGGLQYVESDGCIFYVINDWYPLPTMYPSIKINDSKTIIPSTRHYEHVCHHLREGANFAWKLALEHMQAHPNHKKVVISHFLPNKKSIAPEYKNNPYNAYFLVDRTNEMEQGGVDLFIHGHTHSSVSYKLGKTKVVANPLGYPFEENELVIRQISI